jgi:hypothetical protein
MTLDIYNLKIEVGSNSLQQNAGSKEQKGDMKDRMIQSSIIQKKLNRERLQNLIAESDAKQVKE